MSSPTDIVQMKVHLVFDFIAFCFYTLMPKSSTVTLDLLCLLQPYSYTY